MEKITQLELTTITPTTDQEITEITAKLHFKDFKPQTKLCHAMFLQRTLISCIFFLVVR